jgi:hypothetical protein
MLHSVHRRFLVFMLAAVSVAFSGNSWAQPETTPPPEQARPKHVERVEADRAAATPSSPNSYHGEPFTLDVVAGYQGTDLTTFRSSYGASLFTANVIPSQLSGPTTELGFAWRFYALSLGLRGGVAWLNSSATPDTLELYNVDAEVGLKLPFDRVELSLLFAGGYSVIGGLSDLLHGLGEGLDIDGANVRFTVALDYYFSPQFSIGARGKAEALFLARHGVALRSLPDQLSSFDSAQTALLAGSGTSVGSALSLTVGPAFHF